MSSPVTIHIIDDDLAILTGLKRLLSLEKYKVSTYFSASDFLASYDDSRPGCLIVDLTLPDINGLELQRRLVESDKRATIVFLSGTGDIHQSVLAMKEGAVDFLTKPVEAEDLLRAVRLAIEKDRSMREKWDEVEELKRKLSTLSVREREVFEHVVQGELNKQIADHLQVVEKTIKVHRGRVIRKMGAHSLADLVRMSERLGIGTKLA